MVDVTGPRLVRLGRCGSTQDELRDRLALAAPGGILAVSATEQVAGRGRDGRHWQQPPGAGIALSVGRRGPLPTTLLEDLPARVAQCVLGCVFALDARLSERVEWKPPNDLVDADDGRKLAGVLVDARTVGDDVEELLVGIGINVAGGPFATRDGRHATTLAHLVGREVDAERLLDLLLRAVAAELSEPR